MLDKPVITSQDDYRDADLDDLRAANKAALAQLAADPNRVIGCRLTTEDCLELRESDHAEESDRHANSKYYKRLPNGKFVETEEPDWMAYSRAAAAEWRGRTDRRAD